MTHAQFGSTVSIMMIAGTAFTAQANGCFELENYRQNEIMIPFSSTLSFPLNLVTYSYDNSPSSEIHCSASITVPLSAFPTSRVASRPADFTSHMRDTVREWGLNKCHVFVTYENDVEDALTQEESCLVELFRFQGDSVWSGGSEKYCWEHYNA